MMYNNVGIIGLGLIGGSLAKALKTKSLCQRIIALDSNTADLISAYDEGVVDYYTTELDHEFMCCDIVFLCLPVRYNMAYLEKLNQYINPECIVTDVGSTKEEICQAGCNFFPNFIGGHPMTGSEKSGYGASKQHLFENAYYILTPHPLTEETMLQKFTHFIKELGALPVVMTPDEHDYVTSIVSHTPHVIASALVHMTKELNETAPLISTLAAGGFKDITRIASASPIMWQNICYENKKHIVDVIRKFIESLEAFSDIIESNQQQQLFHLLNDARTFRNSLNDVKIHESLKVYELVLDVEDRPGIIAEVAQKLGSNNINIKNIRIINNREDEAGVLKVVFYDQDSLEQAKNILEPKE